MNKFKDICYRFWGWLRSIRPQSGIAILCCALVLARFLWPDLKFDYLSVYLILVAMLCILVPDLARLISRIKKIKFGDKEIELSETLDRMTHEAENIEGRVSKSETEEFNRSEEPPAHVMQYVRDPWGGLIALAADIERKVQQLLTAENLIDGNRYVPPLRGIEMLAKEDRVVQGLPILMQEFWKVRNQVVHGADIQVTTRDIYRLIDLGVRILDLLSIRRKD